MIANYDLQGTPFSTNPCMLADPLQGRYIPAILASGYIDWTCDIFMALTLEGPSLSDIGEFVRYHVKRF